jgi:hypothetical protein
VYCSLGGALLGVPVHRAQQRVDVDECLLVDAVQHRSPCGERDQMLAQHGGSGVDPAEQPLHPTGVHDIEVVDTVRPAAIPAMIDISFGVALAAAALTRSQENRTCSSNSLGGALSS